MSTPPRSPRPTTRAQPIPPDHPCSRAGRHLYYAHSPAADVEHVDDVAGAFVPGRDELHRTHRRALAHAEQDTIDRTSPDAKSARVGHHDRSSRPGVNDVIDVAGRSRPRWRRRGLKWGGPEARATGRKAGGGTHRCPLVLRWGGSCGDVIAECSRTPGPGQVLLIPSSAAHPFERTHFRTPRGAPWPTHPGPRSVPFTHSAPPSA